MENLLNDFKTFFSVILSCMTDIYNWITSTVIGEILFFTILISLFFFLINLFIDFKDW